MTLKEELEILRGEPIEVFTGDPMDIPCIETSDSERLCKHPVVSVQMITYNHEPYIRQAIEGVMMQKTDFEFELVIGEDCSQDKTREICFEGQKKYPDKIRVLWWHENVSKLGGNSRRVRAHCRGEFIAFCEGDDWWTDPLKLQKQIDVMRAHPNVGLCFTDGLSIEVGGIWRQYWHDYPFAAWFPCNVPLSMEYVSRLFCLGKDEFGRKNALPFVLTATAVVRGSVLRQAKNNYDIFKWRLALGDLIVWLGVLSGAGICYVPTLAVERHVLPTGMQTCGGGRVFRDGFLARYYFAKRNWGLDYSELPWTLRHLWISVMVGYATRLSSAQQREYGRLLWRHKGFRKSLLNLIYASVYILLRIGCLRGFPRRVAGHLLWRMSR